MAETFFRSHHAVHVQGIPLGIHGVGEGNGIEVELGVGFELSVRQPERKRRDGEHRGRELKFSRGLGEKERVESHLADCERAFAREGGKRRRPGIE